MNRHRTNAGGLRRCARLALLAGLLAGAAAAAAHAPALADLSIEELANIEITSVSRRGEQLSGSPASVFVITAEAIRRSGASSLPQLLKLAPNLQVAQIDASQYAISARGFNNAIGNKLLVLIDGRTVYTPFFSGVFWDQQDLLIEDIERIEVISGPGATLWGTNAVNGVINVITRAAAEGDTGLATVLAGTRDHQVGVRVTGPVGATGRLRAYAKHTRLQNSRTAGGGARADGGTRQQLGFRADWAGAGHLTVQGDAYEGRHEPRPFGAMLLTPLEYAGANLLARWTRRFDDGSDLRVQAYVDHTRRDDPFLYRPTIDVADIEFQHGLPLGAHHLLWGGNLRRARDDLQPGIVFGFRPVRQSSAWQSVFVQDKWQLAEALAVDIGLKLERNDYTGTERLPSLRLAWQPAADHLLWGALSRAVRAPARLDRDITLPPRPPFIIAGGPDFRSEVARVAELGYRGRPLASLSLSLTAFAHEWDYLRSGQRPPNAIVQNMIAGTTRGLEGWGSWQATPAWRFGGGFTLLRSSLHVQPGSADPVGPSALGNDPRHQWLLQAAWQPEPRHAVDIDLRRVGALPNPVVPAYTTLDLRWGWRPGASWEVELSGRHLLDASHPEFGNPADRAEIRRQLALRVRAWW